MIMPASFSHLFAHAARLPFWRGRKSLGARALLVAALVLPCGAVLAQSALVGEDYRKVNQLITAKNYTGALQAADAYLTGNPRDPQMRLLRSRVLVAQG